MPTLKKLLLIWLSTSYIATTTALVLPTTSQDRQTSPQYQGGNEAHHHPGSPLVNPKDNQHTIHPPSESPDDGDMDDFALELEQSMVAHDSKELSPPSSSASSSSSKRLLKMPAGQGYYPTHYSFKSTHPLEIHQFAHMAMQMRNKEYSDVSYRNIKSQMVKKLTKEQKDIIMSGDEKKIKYLAEWVNENLYKVKPWHEYLSTREATTLRQMVSTMRDTRFHDRGNWAVLQRLGDRKHEVLQLVKDGKVDKANEILRQYESKRNKEKKSILKGGEGSSGQQSAKLGTQSVKMKKTSKGHSRTS